MATNRSCFQYWYKKQGTEVVAHGKTKKSLIWGGTSKFRKGIYLKYQGAEQVIVFQHEAILCPLVHHTLQRAIADYWIKEDYG